MEGVEFRKQIKRNIKVKVRLKNKTFSQYILIKVKGIIFHS